MYSQAAETLNEVELATFARRIVNGGLTAPALFFLELHKPLSNIFYNLALFAQPIFGPLFGAERIFTLRKLLSRPENIERLCQAIEAEREACRVKRGTYGRQNSSHGGKDGTR